MFIVKLLLFGYRNDPKFSDRLVLANSADIDQTAPLGAVLIRVFTVCYSICFFSKKYPNVWPLFLNFK